MKGRLLRFAYWGYNLQWRLLRSTKLGVRMLLIQDGQVVLVRHSYQPDWYFPGGGVNWGETPLAAAMREAHEEVGAQILDQPQLLGVYSSFYEGKSNHVMTYVSQHFHLAQPTDSWEIAEIGTFALDALPADLSDGSRQRIQEFLAGNGPYSGHW